MSAISYVNLTPAQVKTIGAAINSMVDINTHIAILAALDYSLEGLASTEAIPVAATTTVAGIVEKGDAVADATVAIDGTSAGTQLNALLVSLRAAGIIAA